MSLFLPEAVAAWGRADFAAVLATEVQRQVQALPLQQALGGSSAVADEPVQIMLMSSEADADRIRAKVGVFFSGVIAGCNCADDPTPVSSQPEYCELEIAIDRRHGDATVRLLGD